MLFNLGRVRAHPKASCTPKRGKGDVIARVLGAAPLCVFEICTANVPRQPRMCSATLRHGTATQLDNGGVSVCCPLCRSCARLR